MYVSHECLVPLPEEDIRLPGTGDTDYHEPASDLSSLEEQLVFLPIKTSLQSPKLIFKLTFIKGEKALPTHGN